MKYWKIKEKNNINSFEDLDSFKEKISVKNYEYIHNMLEWNSMDYQEKLEYLKYYSLYNVDKNEFLFFNLNTIKKDKQIELKIISFIKEYPFMIEWILQNWNNVSSALNFNNKDLFIFLTKITKVINYNFKFKYPYSKNLFLNDQWNIIALTDNELLKFINEKKKISGHISIYYLFNKKATLENISKDWELGITRERVRQINVKQIKKNRVFFNKVYEFIKNKIILIEEINISALKVIEGILYPRIENIESILNLNNQFLLDLQEKLENLSFLEFSSEELKILVKNNCIIFYKGEMYKTENKYWGNNQLNFKKMLVIFLKLNYKNTQIVNKSELRIKFYDFLLENYKINKNYNINKSRPFDGLITRIQELLYYDNEKVVVSYDELETNSEIANKIINEFIKLEKQQIIMVSTKKFEKLFNILTNYKFLNINPDFIHNFLKKYCTINNSKKYFSRTPILINSVNNNSTINLFYKQVKVLFNNNRAINWELFLDILESECGLGKTLVQNYVSMGDKYFYKNNNNITLL